MRRNIFDFEFGIIDVDGTLIDSMPIHGEVFATILNEKTGIPKEAAEKFYRETAGLIIQKQFEQILDIYQKWADVSEMVRLFFEEMSKREFKIFPGVKRFLAELHKKRVKLFATSGSKLEDLDKKLRDNGLLSYFKLIMGSDRIPKGVEHIEIFAETCNLPLEEFARRAFYLGDGPTDMKIAKRCGIYAYGIQNTVDAKTLIKAGADEIIETLELEIKKGKGAD